MDRLSYHRLKLNQEELYREVKLTTFFHQPDRGIFSPIAKLKKSQNSNQINYVIIFLNLIKYTFHNFNKNQLFTHRRLFLYERNKV